MKGYKGRILITCTATKCHKKLIDNVQPACIDCTYSRCEVIDLESKTLYKLDNERTQPKPKKLKMGGKSNGL